MIRQFSLALAGLIAFAAAPAAAALKPGAAAPDFTAQGGLGGKPFAFHLRDALKRGPVVLYFFPKAFTSGCTQEAHAFAAAIADFRKAGASVVGMSADGVPQLLRFSQEECRSAFPVASAAPAVIGAYDVPLKIAGIGTGYSDRTSYVIGRDGRIAFAHSAMDWRDHVRLTLQAVRALK